LLIIGFVLIIIVEVPPMAIAGQVRELRAFWVLLALSFVFSLAMVKNWPVPNPTYAIEAVFRPLSDLLGLQ
jgi:hypothetical protein